MDDKIILLRRFLLLVILMVVLDYSVGYFLKKTYFSQKSGVDYRTTYAINGVRSDILILGSSRATHHYNPSIIEDSLKMSAFNGGRDGCSIFYYCDRISNGICSEENPGK